MSLYPQSLDEIDFWDLDMFSAGDPHAAWTILRREAPVWLHDQLGGEPFYAVIKYDDCRRIHAHPDVFSSERHAIVLRNTDSMATAAAGIANPMDANKPNCEMTATALTPRATWLLCCAALMAGRHDSSAVATSTGGTDPHRDAGRVDAKSHLEAER